MDTSVGKKVKIAAAVLAAVALLLPEIVSAGWHLIHGSEIPYRSWRVDVPYEWFAVRGAEGVSVERMTHLSWEKGPVAFFQPMHFGKAYKFDPAVFGAEQARILKRRGYVYDGQKELRIAGEMALCWTYTKWKHPEQLWIACAVPKDLTSVDFIGTRAYASSFYAVLAGIRHLKSSG